MIGSPGDPVKRPEPVGVLGLLIALLVFAAGVATHLDLPGLYFDEVNPDYLVVPLLNEAATNIPAWLPPGNYLFDRWPLLVQLYHGALPVYFGLPLYAVFGTSLEGVRIVHGLFGATVLALTWAAMRAGRVPDWIAALAAVALALDPAFALAWRTQYYILLLPLIPLLGAFLVANRAMLSDPSAGRNGLLAASGLLAGLACYGYFVYFALAPALLWFCLRSVDRGRRWRSAIAWTVGFALGISPYPVGLLLIAFAQGGIDAMLAWVRDSYSVVNTGFDFGSPLDRLMHFFIRARQMLGAESLLLDVFCEPSRRGLGLPLDGQSGASLCEPLGQLVPLLKVGLLVGMAACLPIFSTRSGHDEGYASMFVALVVGMFVLTLVFGRRLQPHHFAPLVPLLYVWAAAGMARIYALARAVVAERVRARQSMRFAVAASIAGLLLCVATVNFVNRDRALRALHETEGAWLFDRSVSRFAESALREKPSPFYMFPDWGFFTVFVMITHGNVPFLDHFSPGLARRSLCAGQNVVAVTTVLGDDPRIEDWTRQTGWHRPTQLTVHERDSQPLFRVLRWRAADGPQTGTIC